MSLLRRGMVATVAALALAGCGSDRGNGGHVASLSGGSSGTPSASATPADPQDQAVKFAQCLRQHGLDVPDPGPDGRIQLGEPAGGDKGAGIDAALRACQQYAPKGKLDPSDPRVLDRMVAEARCLRQHGINVPDPTAQDPRLQLPSGKNLTELKQVLSACQSATADSGAAK